MKTTKFIACAITLCAMSFTMQSCSDDDNQPIYSAVVTVLPEEDGSFQMQLDEQTVLNPVNVAKSPYGQKEVRALINYIKEDKPSRATTENVTLCWIDSIRTKLPVETLGSEDAKVFGDDEVEIVRDWLTVAEDGYLTLRVRTIWGGRGITHSLNLVTGTNPDNPLEFELRHNANGDNSGYWGDALIAFNLNNIPEIKNKDTKIKLKWKSFSGEKSAEFELQVRKEEKTPKDLPSLAQDIKIE